MAAGVLSGLLALSCFAIPPAWAYKAGHGAADRPSGIPEYANIPAYLADANRNNHRHVKIGPYTLPREQVEAFHTANTLTDAKLIASFTNVAAYLADSGRTNRLYADIKGTVYRVTDLEASNTAGILSDTSLPDPVTSLVNSIDRFGTTAVGDGAQATGYDATALGDADATGGSATAVGSGASATGDNATAIGKSASARGGKAIAIGHEAAVTATSQGAIAIGMESRTDGWKSMSIGAHARTHGNAAIAVGRSTQAYGSTSIALGRGALAHGPSVGVTSNGATSLGPGATALGMSATAVGKGAMAAKERDIALLPCVYGPDFYKSSHCSPFLTAAERANPNLRADTEQGETFRAGIQTRLLGVLNTRSAADHATALGGSSRATAHTSTALGHSSWAAGSHGSTAVGGTSRATGERSTALGSTAKAGGLRSTAVGEASQAQGADTVAIGRSAVAGGLTVGETYSNVGKYLADTTRTSHTNVRIGSNVYQVNALEAVTSLTQDNLPTSLTVTTGGVAVGVSARAAGVNSIALGQGASATGSKAIAIGQGVSAGPNEVVVGASTHSYKLPGLATTSGTQVVTVDSNGRLSTQAATSSSSRGASLRSAAALSSEVTALDRDTGTPAEAADYEKAPAIGSGPDAPATAEQRRVVVQDTNRDGSVRLRTLDFGDLSGVDRRLSGVERRVTTLSERLNKATAMSAALSALPNVVPGDKRFFLGVGAGHYSSEQAVAIGMSARVGRHVFVNAGAAVASGDNASVRGGVGVVW